MQENVEHLNTHIPDAAQAPGIELTDYDITYNDVVNPIVQRFNEHLRLHGNQGTVAADSFDQLPGYVGVGADKVVFKAYMPDGRPVAVKLLRRDAGMGLGRSHELSADEVAQETREHAAPLLKAVGKSKLEQLITADPERGILITSFFEGKSVPKMKWGDFRAVSERDLAELQSTMASMRELGLVPENKESIIFKRGEGFSVVDFMDTEREGIDFIPSTISFDTLEGFIKDITIDSGWEADRSAAALAGAPRDSYYDRPVVHGMARGRLLKMARKIQS